MNGLCVLVRVITSTIQHIQTGIMKTTKCNGMDVAKVSDVEGKGMCKNPDYVDYLKRCINWRMNHE